MNWNFSHSTTTTRSHRPMTEIPIFVRYAPVFTSTALRSALTPKRVTIRTPLRQLKFQTFFVTLLFPLTLHCVRHRRQAETPSALHFVIVCASNSIIHVQRSQLETCYRNTTAAAGSRLPLQRPDPTDRWLKFRSYLVTLVFPLSLH